MSLTGNCPICPFFYGKKEPCPRCGLVWIEVKGENEKS